MKQLSLFQTSSDPELFDLINEGNKNPMIHLVGDHPGEKCKNCIYFVRKEYSKTYFKCGLRRDTNGPGTDIRANWQACSKFLKSIT